MSWNGFVSVSLNVHGTGKEGKWLASSQSLYYIHRNFSVIRRGGGGYVILSNLFF